MKVLITAGGTKVPIDQVRYIGNMSKGTFGSTLAEVYVHQQHQVLLLTNPGAPTPPINPLLTVKTYSTFSNYQEATKECIKLFQPDVIYAAAAVSDFGVEPLESNKGKITSDSKITITLFPLPKVLPTFKEIRPDATVIGFKLLVNATDEELKIAAMKTLKNGQCTLVAANNLSNIRNNQRSYTLFLPNGESIQIGPGADMVLRFVRAVHLNIPNQGS